MNVYLDNAAATPLSASMKGYLSSLLDLCGNPSSLHSAGAKTAKIVSKARCLAAEFIHADPDDIFFTPSGSAANTLAIKGITSENPLVNNFKVFCTPTSHKSMLEACASCPDHELLHVTPEGAADLSHLEYRLARHDKYHKDVNPLVCIEAANSEIGTINDIPAIGSLVHRYRGILAVDATGYIPSLPISVKAWKDHVDILTFSGHKLRALKGCGVLWKQKNITLRPLIYGSQERGLVGGTENVLAIASLGKALRDYSYASISSAGRDHVYGHIMKYIPDSYPVGAPVESARRLPCNLYMCFRGIEGESLMILLDLNGIQVSTGSACISKSLSPSAALFAIGMKKEDIHSCIRFSFSGAETKEELEYICEVLTRCVASLRSPGVLIPK